MMSRRSFTPCSRTLGVTDMDAPPSFGENRTTGRSPAVSTDDGRVNVRAAADCPASAAKSVAKSDTGDGSFTVSSHSRVALRLVVPQSSSASTSVTVNGRLWSYPARSTVASVNAVPAAFTGGLNGSMS